MNPRLKGISRTVVLPAMNHMLQTSPTWTLCDHVLVDETIAPEVAALPEWWVDAR